MIFEELIKPSGHAIPIQNIEELIAMTNTQLEETMYIADDIFVPNKNNIHRCYRSDFTLKTEKEAKALLHHQKNKLSVENEKTDFFVYNERTKDVLPFKKNDYLLYEHGYFTFDGINYLSYDDNGNEL